MALNFTPLSWKNVDPTNRDQMKVFLLQLSDFLNSAFNPAFLAFALNSQRLLNGNSLLFKDFNPGTVSTNQTFNCAGAAFVTCRVTFTAAITINFTNLDAAVPVFIQAINSSAGALVLNCTASNPSSVSYGVFSKLSSAGSVDFGITGNTFPATTQFWFWGITSPAFLFFTEV